MNAVPGGAACAVVDTNAEGQQFAAQFIGTDKVALASGIPSSGHQLFNLFGIRPVGIKRGSGAPDDGVLLQQAEQCGAIAQHGKQV